MSILARPNHRQLDCLCNSLLGLTTKRASRLVLLAPYEANPPMAAESPSQRVSNAETFLCHDNDGDVIVVIMTLELRLAWPMDTRASITTID